MGWDSGLWGCLETRRGRGAREAMRTFDLKETKPHSAGWEEVGWGGSGKVARRRRALRNVWALSMPRCTEKLSWQRRPYVQR